MNFKTDNITLLPFSDALHLQNHVKYLLRTDKSQKWTNQYIKYICSLLRIRFAKQAKL